MSVNSSDLVKLYPLDKLRPENLEQLAREASSDEAGRGAVLFKAGDSDEETIFLLSGRCAASIRMAARRTSTQAPCRGAMRWAICSRAASLRRSRR